MHTKNFKENNIIIIDKINSYLFCQLDDDK